MANGDAFSVKVGGEFLTIARRVFHNLQLGNNLLVISIEGRRDLARRLSCHHVGDFRANGAMEIIGILHEGIGWEEVGTVYDIVVVIGSFPDFVFCLGGQGGEAVVNGRLGVCVIELHVFGTDRQGGDDVETKAGDVNNDIGGDGEVVGVWLLGMLEDVSQLRELSGDVLDVHIVAVVKALFVHLEAVARGKRLCFSER